MNAFYILYDVEIAYERTMGHTLGKTYVLSKSEDEKDVLPRVLQDIQLFVEKEASYPHHSKVVPGSVCLLGFGEMTDDEIINYIQSGALMILDHGC